MATPLEKARRDPESTKAKILLSARRVFGIYGFHGSTTRMIAQAAGIDISTLHYHWGDKKDLYEAVIIDITRDLKEKLIDVEKEIRGLPLAYRMNIAIDRMTDYLFANAEISNLILLRYINKTRYEGAMDFKVTEITGNIARSMGLSADRRNISPATAMEVWAFMNSIHTFISGENFFRSITGASHEEYVGQVKETLKFINIPAFTGREEKVR